MAGVLSKVKSNDVHATVVVHLGLFTRSFRSLILLAGVVEDGSKGKIRAEGAVKTKKQQRKTEKTLRLTRRFIGEDR